VAEVIERIRLFRIPFSESLVRLRGLRLSVLGAAIAHAGMGVTVAGIAGMAFATQSVVLLHPGEKAQAAGMTWTLESMTNGAGSNYSSRIANLRVSRPGEPDLLMHPSRRTFPVQQITTTEAAIRTTGLADIYAVMGEERDGAAVLRLNYNPLAPWIWLGGLVMAIGGGMSLVDRRLRVGAPARRAAAVPA
jgi:cytochrome c-type biogenesis protein CcmF